MRDPAQHWPTWPELTHDTGELHPENVTIKKQIAAEYGEDALRRSWLAVCAKLKTLTDEIKEKQSDMIPEVSYDDFFKLSEEEKTRLKSTGCFVVRGTVSKETANAWFEDLQQYISENDGVITGQSPDREYVLSSDISGWPKETPYIMQLYWSRAQLQARTNPRSMALHRALNSLWHDDDDPEKKFAAPLAYADALRIRPGGVPFTGLGPHIDAGSLCRWGESYHRKIYDKIFSGKPDEYDPYDLTYRKLADPAFYPGPAQSHVLRAFQGWTALTRAGAHEGSLLLYPDVKTVIAYVLLRPFFRPPENVKDILEAEKWTFDLEDPWFPGVMRHMPQEMSPEPFPHMRMKDCLVNIPTMYPGDTIWWHCDMCHAVEVEHSGTNISSAIYVAATPTTAMNQQYMQGQLKDFLDGVSPEDFRGGCYEKGLKGFPGETAILNGQEGRRAVGFAV